MIRRARWCVPDSRPALDDLLAEQVRAAGPKKIYACTKREQQVITEERAGALKERRHTRGGRSSR